MVFEELFSLKRVAMRNFRDTASSFLTGALLCLAVSASAWATGPVPGVALAGGDPVAFTDDTVSDSLLDESCVISVLNRTIQVSSDGGWSLPNLPANQGAVRARATCSGEDGSTQSGQSEYFNILANSITRIGEIVFENLDPIPVNIMFTPADAVVLDTIGATLQLSVTATYADDSTADVTAANSGTNYSSTNTGIATVSPQGLVTAVGNGLALITARKDGVLAARTVQVVAGGDLDGDGLPDDYESANGLNPNDPVDAFEDQDGDGLSALQEFNAGTNPRVADTDGDGIDDGEELTAGVDGFITNPLLADSDGDGLSDGVEVAVGSDPNDADDTDIEAALVSLVSTPASVVMTFNGIDSEVSAQLTISGVLIDGSLIDLTNAAATSYSSSDISIVSFGITKGEIFGGQPGSAVVTVTSSGKSVAVGVTVRDFEATALSAIDIPGYANNVDISGDYAFIAAGAAGLQVVDVADRVNPELVAELDTDGTAIDIRLVGNIAYIADGEAGLKVVDVTDPLQPQLLGQADTAGVAQDLFVQLSYAYVANGAAGIEIFDISESANPLPIATLENLDNVTGISVEQDLAVVTGGSALIAIDVSDPVSPMRLGSINIGAVKDVVLENGYAHVAAYSQGYRVVDVTNPVLPRVTGGDSSIAPRDVALTRNFAFYAEQLFPNVVAFINIFDPENPLFQGTIDLSPFGDYAGTGIALDASYAYITEESYVVSSDYKASGSTRLFIAQYRDINDNNGVPPTVSITSPADGSVVVEGRKLVVTADAEDDVAVASVSFLVDGELVFTDTSAPYQMSVTVPAPGDADLAIEATARDLGANSASSGIITVEIQPDGDGDGLGDDEEVDTWDTDPENPDSDSDGLTDGEEVRLGTNPNESDSDNDGIDDKTEVDNDTDPLNPDVTPPTVTSTNPDDGATDIPENSSITVLFDEPLRAKSVVAGTLKITPEGSSTPIAGSLQLVAGNTELLFVPAALMQDFTLYTIAIEGVKDAAGNVMVPVERSFTTGNLIDTVRPSVTDISPANGANDVALNSLIDVVLSEPIIPDTVTSDTFYVDDLSTNQRFEGTLSVSDDKTSISFVPNSPFLVGRQYRVTLTTGIQDLFGLALIGTSRSFTTSFESDGQAPLVVATTVADGATQVPVNALLNVAFSEVISALYVADIKLFDSVGAEVPVVRSLSANKQIVSLDPVAMLAADSDYVFSIDGVRDLSGNLLPNRVQVAFRTGAEADTTIGGINNWSYVNSATLPLNAVLEVELSERIDPTTINTDGASGQSSFVLYSNTQNRFIPGEGVLAADGRHLRFVSEEALQAGHSYRLYVTYNTYLYDLAGNRINGTSRTFTAGDAQDTTEPVVTNTSLPNGATDVAVNSRLIFSTDEQLSDSCLDRVLLMSGGVPVDASVALASDRRTITVTPAANLSSSADYSLMLDGLCDYAGNALVTTILSFTTAASDVADTTGPVLQSIVPASNASDVPVTTSIAITYNEALSLLTAPVVSGAGVTVPGDYVVADATVTFTPAIDLLGNTQYSVNTTAVDRAGNSRSSGTYRFTTSVVDDSDAPTLLAISPEANAIDVSPASSVVLSFSEPMAPATLTNANISLFANGNLISPSVFRSVDGREVTLTATLPSESVVAVVITDRVTDLSGNPIAPLVSAFTTSALNTDGGRPSVSRVLPANGSNNWLGINEVVMYINEPLDADSVEAAFHIVQNGTVIDGQGVLEVLGNGQTVRFTKDTAFEEGALIQVYLSDEATDLANNPLNNYSAYFSMGTTSDGVGVRPVPQAYSPASNSRNVSLNPALQVLWSEPLDPDSLTDSTVWLEQEYNGTRVPVTISLNTQPGDVGFETVPGQIMTVVPTEVLDVPEEPATTLLYYLRLESGITDTDGDTHNSSTYQYFYTGPESVVDDRAPMILALNPPDGETDVGTNPHYAVRLDESVSSFIANAGVFGTTNSILFSENNQVVRYARVGTLPANEEVTETLPTFSDQAGNAVTGSTTFTTAAGPDLSGGAIVSASVINGATGVAQNPVLVREFSEPLDPVSVSESGVYLYDSSTNSNVPTSLDLSADGRRLTLVPLETLSPGRLYYWYAFSLRDLSGNNMSGSTYSFTTGFEEDGAGPLFRSATVFDGQTQVPINVRLSVQFDEPLSPLAAAGIALVDESSTAVIADVSFSGDRRTVTLVPRSLLAANSSYTLTVADVEDISGNPLLTPISIGFTTGLTIDNVNGGINNWSYVNSATLPLNAVLEVELSERIDPTTINTDGASGQSSFVLYSNTQNRFIPGEGVLAADGRHLRFVSEEALQAGHSYRLYVTYNTYLYDLAGNRINGTSRTFTASNVEDNIAPVVQAVTLSDGLTGVPTNTKLNVRFSEAINVTSITDFDLRDALNNTVPTSLTANSTLDLLTLNLSAQLAPSSAYRLNIVGIDDIADNQLAVPAMIDFTTGLGEDTVRGNIIQWSFDADEVLALDATLEVILDERVDPTSVDAARFYLWDETLNANVPGAISVAADGTTLTFDPDDALEQNHQYRLYVSYSYFTDLAGNLINRGSRRFFSDE